MIALLVTLVVLAALPLPYAVGEGGLPSLRRSPVTILLVAVNVAVFLATHLSLKHGLVEPLSAFSNYGLVPAYVHPRDLVTYAFLHISGAHLLWNMVYLYLFGPSVEEKVGSALYAALYLLGGAAAGWISSEIVMHVAANTSAAYVPVVGASGAISALLGLFAVFAGRRPLKLFWTMGYLTHPNRSLLEVPAIFGIGLWLVQTTWGAAVSLVNQDASNVAYFAHIGGFLVGVALGAIASQARQGMIRHGEPDLAAAAARSAGRVTQDSLGAVGKALDAGTAAVSAERYTEFGLVGLLGRAIDDRDVPRAEALHAKCRAMKLAVPQSLVDGLDRLRPNPASASQTGASGAAFSDAMLPKN